MISKSREKFVLLAEARMGKALNAMRLIGNLSNKSNYSYSEDDAKKLIKALENEIRIVKQRFESGNRARKADFKL